MSCVISCTNITRKFEDVTALDNISFELEKNRVYGLIGRNGAGKTTLLKILSNQLFPDSGDVCVDGVSIFKDELQVEKICFMRDNILYFKDLKIRDIFDTASLRYRNWDTRLMEKLVKKFRIPIKKSYVKLSKGMQSAVGIIIGLCSRADVTLFDEVHSGLDPVSRDIFYETLAEEISSNPRTIVISSHLVNEVESLLDEVIILNEGKLVMKENIDYVQQRAFCLVGNKERIDKYTVNKKVVKQEEMGRFAQISIFDELYEEEINGMKMDDIEIMPLDIQKLFVALISNQVEEDEE